MDEFEQAIDKAAQDLYKVYWDALGIATNDWDLVQENQKRGWRAVAAAMGNALSNVIAVYGYNGDKSDFKGLDAMIAPPDHR
jgi:hypothetical protein